MKTLKDSLPSIHQVKLVYSLQVFLVYSWVILSFFYDLPRWTLFLSILEIIVIFAYSLVFAFIDSVIFLAVLVIPSVFFYSRFLRRKYESVIGVVAISSYIWLGIMWSQYLHDLREGSTGVDDRFLLWLALSIVSTLLIGFVVSRIIYLQKIIHVIADRAQVFLYIYLPLSLLALFVVVMRNVI
jgi:hypothetical protein